VTCRWCQVTSAFGGQYLTQLEKFAEGRDSCPRRRNCLIGGPSACGGEDRSENDSCPRRDLGRIGDWWQSSLPEQTDHHVAALLVMTGLAESIALPTNPLPGDGLIPRNPFKIEAHELIDLSVFRKMLAN